MSGWDSVEIYQPSFFEEVFTCLPFDRYKNPELETGNKIVMPPSSLSRLQTLRWPWFFKLEVFDSEKVSHCGVLEFCAEEGFVYMPRWMMMNLGIEDGDRVILRDARPTRGTRMLLRPHRTAFVEVSNVKAVLETALRGFSCVTTGDTIMIRYNGQEFYIDVLDVGPGGEVISLIETDCVVEFEQALDYVEPPPPQGEEEEVRGFRPFTGRAMRLDGREGAAAVVEEEDGGKVDVTRVDKIVEEVREFRPFAGAARRLDGGSAVAAERRERDGGRDEGREEFKAFAGRGRVLGGSFFD